MATLLQLSRLIDRFSEFIGRWIAWLVLAAVLISAINAAVRKAFNTSSNAYLEIQWYLFAAVFLLAAGYTMLRQGHVKIDVISSKLSKRKQIWIDILGFTFFLMPMCLVILYYGIPFFLQGFRSGEMSSNAGGLIRWPVYICIPIGFSLLLLQGLSELIKRVAFLRGLIPDPTEKVREKTPEEELAEEVRRQAEELERAAAAARKA